MLGTLRAASPPRAGAGAAPTSRYIPTPSRKGNVRYDLGETFSPQPELPLGPARAGEGATDPAGETDRIIQRVRPPAQRSLGARDRCLSSRGWTT